LYSVAPVALTSFLTTGYRGLVKLRNEWKFSTYQNLLEVLVWDIEDLLAVVLGNDELKGVQ
jgi:hypothetical protein